MYMMRTALRSHRITDNNQILKVIRVALTLAFVSAIFVTSIGVAHAAPTSRQPAKVVPNVTECSVFIITDKKTTNTSLDPKSGNGYTLTVWVEFMYDAYFNHGLCYTRSKAQISESGNLYGGTLYLYLSNCSSTIDTVTPSVPGGGGGPYIYYGNKNYAGCGDVTANFKASNGYWLPGQYSFADSDRQLS